MLGLEISEKLFCTLWALDLAGDVNTWHQYNYSSFYVYGSSDSEEVLVPELYKVEYQFNGHSVAEYYYKHLENASNHLGSLSESNGVP